MKDKGHEHAQPARSKFPTMREAIAATISAFTSAAGLIDMDAVFRDLGSGFGAGVYTGPYDTGRRHVRRATPVHLNRKQTSRWKRAKRKRADATHRPPGNGGMRKRSIRGQMLFFHP